MPDLPILMTLAILVVAIILFVTERLRMDLVALLVLASLAVSGLVTPAEALSGFSNLAVVTATAVFILSGGLSRTGVAGLIGRQALRLAGQGEMRLLIVIMLAAAMLSAFMDNIGVAALLLPVVVDVARRTGRPPSKFLMPLAFAALLGGLGSLGVLAGIYILGSMITEPMSNAAAAVLVVPIAIDTALGLGANPQAFVLAAVIGAATSFLTPVGHQANVLVFGPGGYRFFDYTRVGAPLNVALFVATMVFLPLLWPLFK
jgi:di/tricarboxylate transporter